MYYIQVPMYLSRIDIQIAQVERYAEQEQVAVGHISARQLHARALIHETSTSAGKRRCSV